MDLKISELIKLLEYQKQVHGDVTVSLFGKVYSKNEITLLNSWNPILGDHIELIEK